jgi:hypothetical protein
LIADLKPSSILAHRGYFLEPSEKNSSVAIKRAISHGFGVETDIRDHNGSLVISHDPPLDSPEPLPLKWLFDLVHSTGSDSRIALNIKADGLTPLLGSAHKSSGINLNQIFVFDMSVPDSIGFLASDIPSYSRISEYELEPSIISQIQGVWVDNFTGEFPQVRRAAELLDRGLRAAIVSPELHRRDPAPLWSEILEARLYENPLFELCTDLPVKAAETFCSP